MPHKQLYLCTKWGNQKRPSRANRYTDNDYSEPLWHAGLTSGTFPGQGMNFYFELEAQAAHFSLWSIYDPGTVMAAGDAGKVYVADEPYKIQFDSGQNWYTDTILRKDSWIIPMYDPMGQNFLDLRFPNERQARGFKKGRAYKLQDLFGTTLATNADNSGALEAASAAAKAAALAKTKEAAAISAKQIADASSYAALADFYADQARAYAIATTTSQSLSVEQANAASAQSSSSLSLLNYQKVKAIAAVNSGANVYLAAALKSAQAASTSATNASNFLNRVGSIYLNAADGSQPTKAGVQAHYFVVNGGAGGYYKTGPLLKDVPDVGGPFGGATAAALIAAGMLFYNTGTWTQPYNGYFTGVFAWASGQGEIGLY